MEIGEIAATVQNETRETVELARVDQRYTGKGPKQAAAEHGIALEVVKLTNARRGFVLLPQRWIVERDFGWMSRCPRPTRDPEGPTFSKAFTCLPLPCSCGASPCPR